MKKSFAVTVILFCQFCAYAQNWQMLLGAPNKYLDCFYEDTVSDRLFVAGNYSLIGGNDYRGIATWDGAAWDSLGAGIDDSISSFPQNTLCIERWNSDILIGGAFDRVGSIASPYFARWNGTQWDTMFGGLPNNVVDGIVTYNGELYINGVFDSIGNVSTHGIAKWNGSSWESVAGNYDFNNAQDGIRHMVFYHGNLYVSGFFRDQWGTLCRLAKWNGSTWQFMINELQGGLATIQKMIVFNDELYVGGLFYNSDGNVATGIMRWDDTTWRDVGGSITVVNNPYPDIKDMCVHNNKLYCVGSFEKIGGIDALGLASWDGTNWCGYNTNFELAVGQFIGAGCVAFYHDTLYAGGGFHYVNTLNFPFLAKWVGGSFVDTCGNTTGISNVNMISTSIAVFPNPAANNVTIITERTENTYVEVFDISGRLIEQSESSNNQNIVISIEDYAEGVYFIRLIQDGASIGSQKFLIVR